MRIGAWAKTAFLVVTFGGLAGAQAGPSPQPGPGAPDGARALVQQMIEGMGGAERLRGIRSIRAKSIGYYHHMEQSERPEGPWIVNYTQVNELRDFEHARLRHEEQARAFFYQSADWVPVNWVFEGGAAASLGREGRVSPRDAFSAQQAEESLELGPERVGLTALLAADLHLAKDTVYRDHPHAVAAFTWKGFPVRILISRESGLPSAVELTRARPESVFWGPWGDVTFRKSYALWTLEPGGVRLPRTIFTEWNGLPLASQTVDEITLNPPSADADFAIPAEVKQAFLARKASIEDLPLGRASTPPQEIAPGLTQIRGSWDVGIVRQPDGLVIIEGPISSGYSAKVMADARQRYPGLPIKAVLTTSDSWPHIGGLREYVAEGIPIYALDHNRPILERLLAAPRRTAPDALARSPKPARFTFVSKRAAVGTGPNRFEIIPLRTVTGERQMALWFPELKLLYCSDLFQRDQKGEFFLPQTVSEMVSVVAREKLEVTRAFAMHLPLTPWEEIAAALDKHVRN